MSNMDSDERQLFNREQAVEIVKNERSNKKVKLLDLIPQLLASCLMYLLVIQAGVNMSFASVLISQLGDEGEIDVDTSTASIIGSIWSIALPFGAITSGNSRCNKLTSHIHKIGFNLRHANGQVWTKKDRTCDLRSIFRRLALNLLCEKRAHDLCCSNHSWSMLRTHNRLRGLRR
jgi:hypothetical protein